ncbi:MAG: WcaF family extracellular polysaccharide biosynthesis acetyltransferase [Bryobacteraceae bacterium]|jgi:putative colanic acid biosynthesis acetyltransferase WcaF
MVQTPIHEQPATCASRIDLSVPDNGELVRGAPLPIEAAWYFFGLPLLRSSLIASSPFRRWLLRLFGAKIGRRVHIKPGLRVKFPWYLEVGDHTWLGEDLWIDNLAQVTIGPHCCLSQGAYLCTGNHDWSAPNMKLFRRPIRCEQGSWVGAKCVVCPGVTLGAGAVASAGSVIVKDIPAMEVHAGNPASFVRRRKLAGC